MAGGDHGYELGEKTNRRNARIVGYTVGWIVAAMVHQPMVKAHDIVSLVLVALNGRPSRFHRMKSVFADSDHGRTDTPAGANASVKWIP
jgi:hypothetical protein